MSKKHTQGRVAFATVVGTSIEWYDYFLYAAASGLIFNQLFFGPLGSTLSTMVAFATVGISFLFRPLGAFLAGHYGDKLGRRVVLIITLIAMGAATALIGFLPTYESIGIAAPILLIVLRIIQGISAGGEWGGAVLLAVEHAEVKHRGLRGSFPQIGVSIGLILSSGVLALMTVIAPGEAFLEWGWRVPFFLSILLVAVGYWIRRGVEESPVFHEIAERKEQVTNPLGKLLKNHWLLVILASLVFVGNNAAGYMTTGGYIQNYATDSAGSVGLERGPVLWAVSASAVSWLIFTIVAGSVSDKIGRKNTYLLGWALLLIGIFSLFPLVNTGSIWMLFLGLVILTVGLGFTYGQQPAMYAEIFPSSVRFSGVSVSYAIGSILGGAFAPTIAKALVSATGTTTSVAFYLAIMTVIALIATLLLRDRSGMPLGPDHEEEQSVSPIIGVRS
ncbi:Sugar phosphate permease [Brevibacterium sandarakinum]|uniref:Sugar phosphate permease n=1 Tax=Brevibacterium sandarakinum TaxID=629680 RepID=A0A1H1NEB4_BRESA|nr:Sugar phosphate permease [Brevibacterium sandarakinum]